MGTITEAREEFSHDLYATKLSGAEIDEIGENFARCSMKLTENHRNAYGEIIVGAIYTLADFAFVVASDFGKEMATVSVVVQAIFLSCINLLNSDIIFPVQIRNFGGFYFEQ